MGLIKQIIFKLTWRRKLCKSCSNQFVVGNYGPCYSCKLGSKYSEK